MGEISRTTVSSKSPRQMIGPSCMRTAGVGSTGMSGAEFTAGVSKSVALVACVASPRFASRSVASAFVASVASVASQFTVPGALRPGPSVSSGIVASSRSPRDRCEQRSAPVVPVASVLRGVSSVGCVESSPKSVLRQAFQKSCEAARDSLCRRLSRRFGGSSPSKAPSGRVEFGSVAFSTVASASGSVAFRSVH